MQNRETCGEKRNELSVGHLARLEWKSEGYPERRAARFTPSSGLIAVRRISVHVQALASYFRIPCRTSRKWAVLVSDPKQPFNHLLNSPPGRHDSNSSQTVMSGGITGFVDVAVFLSQSDRIHCASFGSFLVRNWCGHAGPCRRVAIVTDIYRSLSANSYQDDHRADRLGPSIPLGSATDAHPLRH